MGPDGRYGTGCEVQDSFRAGWGVVDYHILGAISETSDQGILQFAIVWRNLGQSPIVLQFLATYAAWSDNGASDKPACFMSELLSGQDKRR